LGLPQVPGETGRTKQNSTDVGARTYGNKMADQLARQGSSCPLTGPEPALGISAKVAREVIRNWTNRKHEEYWQSIHEQKQTTGFLKRPSAYKTGKLFNLSRN
jgi:hypothetical protein